MIDTRWHVEMLMDDFAPRMARLHNHKMSLDSLAVFSDWLAENGHEKEREYLDNNRGEFEENLIQRLDPSEFPFLHRVSEFVVSWVQRQLFNWKVCIGPISDARWGCDSWAEYQSLEQAKAAGKAWSGIHVEPPSEGLIRYHLRGRELVKESEGE